MMKWTSKTILAVTLSLLLVSLNTWAKTPSVMTMVETLSNSETAMRQQENKMDIHVNIALEIAHLYGLTRDQAIVLLAIYEHEDGGPGKEFGIEWRPCKYKDGRQSFLENCGRCCKLILQHCPDSSTRSIKAMNYGGKNWSGYAADKDWWRGVRRGVRKYRDILYN